MSTQAVSKQTAAHARLEHVNITVTDTHRTAELLHRIFGWTVRWEGESLNYGHTIHLGSQTDYIAIYSNGSVQDSSLQASYAHVGFNHVAIEVDDLDDIKARVISEGLDTYDFGEYEPGRRFYFRDHDSIEYEVVSYAS